MTATLDRLAARRSQAVPSLMHRLAQQDRLVHQEIEAISGSRWRVDGRWVLTFASTNYLGLAAKPQILTALSCTAARYGISLATPRLLATDRLTGLLESEIASLVGQETAIVFPSTTHVALDVLRLLAGPQGMLLLDERAYPISLEGARAAAHDGARLSTFPHNDHYALRRALQAHANIRDKVIVCDGVYPAGGRPAALREITAAARRFDATVYVDDAHGLGLLGEHPTADMPYGHGGGGTPLHLGAPPGNIVHVGSLSKGLGVPVAFAAGPARFIEYVQKSAASYSHSSPPAIPMLGAALAALRTHALLGEAQRRRLLRLVRRFRAGIAGIGAQLTSPGVFPIQTLTFPTPAAATAAGRYVRQRGVWPVLQLWPPEQPRGGALRFVLTAVHDEADVDEAVEILSCALRLQLHRRSTRIELPFKHSLYNNHDE